MLPLRPRRQEAQHHINNPKQERAQTHAEAGPAGLAQELATAPELAPCVVQNVAQAFLGRALAPEDDPWKTQLVKVFVDGGYRMRALVRAIVTSPRYRAGNDAKGPR